VPPANPTPATAIATTARIDNDHLGLHCQIIDLEGISHGDGQWHRIRSFRRNSPTERPDASNSNDGTRQIREHRAATHCSHEFSPSFECSFESCNNICQVKSFGSLQRFKLSSPICIEAHQTCTHRSLNRAID
jgi:hypothetical protein